MKELFKLTNHDRNVILEMHKMATKSNYVKINLHETKKTINLSATILRKNKMDNDNAEAVAILFDSKISRTSDNQKDAPKMTKLYVKFLKGANQRDERLERRVIKAFNTYLFFENKNLLELSDDLTLEIKPNKSVMAKDITTEKNNIQIESIEQFEYILTSLLKNFSTRELVSGQKNIDKPAGIRKFVNLGQGIPDDFKKKYLENVTTEVKDMDLVHDGQNDNTFSIYKGFSQDSCIKFSVGTVGEDGKRKGSELPGLQNQSFSFCIGSALNNQYTNYRINQQYTIYFIVDWKAVSDAMKKANGDKSEFYKIYDKMYVLMLRPTTGPDKTKQYYICKLVNESNEAQRPSLNKLLERLMEANFVFNDDAVWTDDSTSQKFDFTPVIFKYKKISNKERTLANASKEQITDLDTFKNLPYESKKLYLSTGQVLTDEQFNYLLNMEKLNFNTEKLYKGKTQRIDERRIGKMKLMRFFK